MRLGTAACNQPKNGPCTALRKRADAPTSGHSLGASLLLPQAGCLTIIVALHSCRLGSSQAERLIPPLGAARPPRAEGILPEGAPDKSREHAKSRSRRAGAGSASRRVKLVAGEMDRVSNEWRQRSIPEWAVKWSRSGQNRFSNLVRF